MNDFYSHPKYYEIAFSFRDIKKEVDVFEESIRRFSKIPVYRVLELASGTSPHLLELTRRGYEYLGLDINEAMLNYARQKALAYGIEATFYLADMRRFSLEEPVDFVYTMLGSLYAETTDDLFSHFATVAQALNPGGLYFLDWCVNFEWDGLSNKDQSWTIEKERIKIDVKFKTEEVINHAAQICKHRLLADVNDQGKVFHLESVEVGRTVFPQEFLLLVEKSKRFEFIGWWNNWNLDEPIEKATHIDRPITLIRRV